MASNSPLQISTDLPEPSEHLRSLRGTLQGGWVLGAAPEPGGFERAPRASRPTPRADHIPHSPLGFGERG